MALNEDWGTHLDGKQIQRWSEALGRTVMLERDAEARAHDSGPWRLATPYHVGLFHPLLHAGLSRRFLTVPGFASLK